MMLIAAIVSLVAMYGCVVAGYRFRPIGLIFGLAIAGFLAFGPFIGGPINLFALIFYFFVLLGMAVYASRQAKSAVWMASRAIFAMAIVLFLSAIPVLIAYGEFEKMRAALPMEDLEARLPVPKHPYKGDAKAQDQWAEIEDSTGRGMGALHRIQMRNLHENQVFLFQNSLGFGAERMLGIPSENLWGRLKESKEVLAMELKNPMSGLEANAKPAPLEAFNRTHIEGIGLFANLRFYGYVRDRNHVAGNIPHHFHRDLDLKDVRVEYLGLVSLLKHEKPGVYVSEHLPNMRELRDKPLRELDDFEARALQEIIDGKEMMVAQQGERVRMMGAIRNYSQCTQCHGGELGDLLGAFTYQLRLLK